MAKWADKDLGEFDKFLSQDGVEQRIENEFTDALAQATDDLTFAETVINEIWRVAQSELTSVNTERYHAGQAKGLDRDPTQRFAELVSSETTPTSGSVIVRKK